MAEPEAEVDHLHRELSDVEREFWKEFEDLTTSWQFKFGPIRFRRRVSNMFIAQVFVAFHLSCFAGGIGLIFTTGPTRELGIALVVGSIFAFGSFVSQFWAVSLEQRRAVYKEAVGDLETRDLKQLAKKREQIMNQLKQLEGP
jgi:hypothetical protein